MLSYLIRRLAIMAPMMLAATFLMFMIVSFSGDPLAEVRTMQPPPPPDVIEQMAKTLRLDQPVLTRYWLWLTGVLTGDFGPSLRGMDIGAELVQRIGVSLRLLALGLLIAFVMAILATIVGAIFQFSIADHILSVIAVITISMPVFWLAILLKRGAIEINRTVGFRLLYTMGDGSGFAAGTTSQKLLLLVGVLSLPTLALALQSFGTWSRYGRVALIEAMTSEYVKLARAKGLSETRVVLAHGLRTSLAPMLTVMTAGAAVILGESVVTEQVFQWRGMGDLLVSGIQNNDVYVVLAWLLVAGLLIMIFNLVADLLYAILDPRIRYDQ
ncbi:ABC transporter permease (plasmid) [Agrobacterium deltaense]